MNLPSHELPMLSWKYITEIIKYGYVVTLKITPLRKFEYDFLSRLSSTNNYYFLAFVAVMVTNLFEILVFIDRNICDRSKKNSLHNIFWQDGDHSFIHDQRHELVWSVLSNSDWWLIHSFFDVLTTRRCSIRNYVWLWCPKIHHRIHTQSSCLLEVY
jgi:hypothetical protein